MCITSSECSRSFIKSLILIRKVFYENDPFARSCIITLFMSLKSFNTLFFLPLNLAPGTCPRHTPECSSQVRLEEFQERGWVNRQRAAASQIPARDGNCPCSCPAHRDPEISKGDSGKLLWNSQEQFYASTVLSQALSNLTAVLVDRPGANLLYSHLPFELSVAEVDPDF